jgi:hypothetical protein
VVVSAVVSELDTSRRLMVQLRSLGEDIRQVQNQLAAAEVGTTVEPSRLTQKHWRESAASQRAPAQASEPNGALAENASLLRRK